MPKQRDVTANGDVKAMGCQSNIGDPSLVTLGVETNETELETRQHLRMTCDMVVGFLEGES